MNPVLGRFLSILVVLSCLAAGSRVEAAGAQRVKVTGEVIDTWCYVTEIMYAQGSAHFQCAVWCAVGGIPVSIRAADGTLYVLLRVEGDDRSVSNPAIVRIQGHKVEVDGDLIRRDGVNYLLVTKVATDAGIVDLTHEVFGIQPWGM